MKCSGTKEREKGRNYGKEKVEEIIQMIALERRREAEKDDEVRIIG